MPRHMDTATPEPSTLEAVPDTNGASDAPKRGGRRTRKVAPEGVATGLFDEFELDTPPPATTGFGNPKAAANARRVIEICKANPGQWVKIGRFSNQTMPKGIWQDNGIKFTHRADPEVPGWYLRWAMLPFQGE